MPNRINYQLEMEKVLRTLGGTRPKLLLHACCVVSVHKALRLIPCDRKAEGIRCPELQPHSCGTSHLLRSSMRANRPAAINLLPAKDSIRRSAPYNVTRVSPMSRQMRCGVKSSTLRQPSVSRLPPRSAVPPAPSSE